jgi:hypothetical protein
VYQLKIQTMPRIQRSHLIVVASSN